MENIIEQLRKGHKTDIFQQEGHLEWFATETQKPIADYDQYMEMARDLDCNDAEMTQYNYGYESCLKDIERLLN